MKKIQKWTSRCFVLFAALCLWSATAPRAHADGFSAWHFYANTTIIPQEDISYQAVYVDFSHLLTGVLQKSGTLDENSIRVVPIEDGKPGTSVPFRFTKDADYDATTGASGTIVFQVNATAKPDPVQYRIYFDTQANGTKPAIEASKDVPDKENLIWNCGFEILTTGYLGPNRYRNAGVNMPVGWWGNLNNGGIESNVATSAHTGEHALGFVTPAGRTNVGIFGTPTPPGLRVVPKQSYVFSFWVKGDGLTSRYPIYGYIYWYDKDGKFLNRVTIGTLPWGKAQFDWSKSETTLAAPADAYYGSASIGTYSTTGLVTADDFEMRISIPPSVEDVQLNK